MSYFQYAWIMKIKQVRDLASELVCMLLQNLAFSTIKQYFGASRNGRLGQNRQNIQ